MNSITLTLTVNSPELAKKLIDIAAGNSAAPETEHTPAPANQTTPAFPSTQQPAAPAAVSPAPAMTPFTAPTSAVPISSAAPFTAPYTPPAPAASVTPPQQPNPASTIPTAPAPNYTIADLQNACAPLMDAGRQQDLINLLKSFGVPALTLLPKERYGEFATALRGLGAQI